MDNPKLIPIVAVGAVVFNNNRVLLVKRKNPPAQNQWSIPGGKVHWGETLQEAAEREILEETGIVIKARDPVYTFDVVDRDPHGSIKFHYVIIDLSAEYQSGKLVAGDDAGEARWFSQDELSRYEVNVKTRQLLSGYTEFK